MTIQIIVNPQILEPGEMNIQDSPTTFLLPPPFSNSHPLLDRYAAMSLPPSKLTGCDFSGTFAKANDSSPSGHGFCEGDRVAGIIRGCKDSHAGKFAEYLVADPHMCFLVPREMRLEEACTLGVGWVSATQALQQRLFEDVGEGGEKRGLVRSMR